MQGKNSRSFNHVLSHCFTKIIKLIRTLRVYERSLSVKIGTISKDVKLILASSFISIFRLVEHERTRKNHLNIERMGYCEEDGLIATSNYNYHTLYLIIAPSATF